MATPTYRSGSAVVASAASGVPTLTIPSGVVSGELMVAAIAVPANNFPSTITIPTGWTSLGTSTDSGGISVQFIYKQFAGESTTLACTGTYNGSWRFSFFGSWSNIDFTGYSNGAVYAPDVIGVFHTSSGTAATAIPVNSISIPGTNDLVLVMGAARTSVSATQNAFSDTTDTPTLTSRVSETATSGSARNMGTFCFEVVTSAAGSTTAYSITDSNAANYITLQVAFRGTGDTSTVGQSKQFIFNDTVTVGTQVGLQWNDLNTPYVAGAFGGGNANGFTAAPNLVVPSTAVSGETLVSVLTWNFTAGGVFTPPTGWIKIFEDTSNVPAVWVGVATAPLSTASGSLVTSCRWYSSTSRLDNVNASGLLDGTAGISYTSGTSFSDASISTSYNYDVILHIYAAFLTATGIQPVFTAPSSTPNTYTFFGSGGGNTAGVRNIGLGIAYEQQPVAGASNVRNATVNSSGDLHHVEIAFKVSGTTTAVGASIGLQWNLIAHVGVQLGYLWNTAVDVGRSVGLVWNAPVVVGNQISAVWNDRAVVGLSRTELWNILGTAYPPSNNIVWNLNNGSAPTLGSPGSAISGETLIGVVWYNSAGGTFTPPSGWTTIVTPDTSQSPAIWVGLALAPWTAANGALTATTRWLSGVFRLDNVNFAGAVDVSAISYVSGNVSPNAPITTNGAQELILHLYGIQPTLAGDIPTFVLGSFPSTTYQLFDSRSSVSGTVRNLMGVIATEGVLPSGTAIPDRPVTFASSDTGDLRKLTIAIRNAASVTTTQVGANLGLQWNDRAVIGVTRQLIYNVPILVGSTRQLIYNVRAVVGLSNQELWNVLVSPQPVGAAVTTTGTSLNPTLNLPASIASTDVVIGVLAWGGAARLFTPPAGWATLATGNAVGGGSSSVDFWIGATTSSAGASSIGTFSTSGVYASYTQRWANIKPSSITDTVVFAGTAAAAVGASTPSLTSSSTDNSNGAIRVYVAYGTVSGDNPSFTLPSGITTDVAGLGTGNSGVKNIELAIQHESLGAAGSSAISRQAVTSVAADLAAVLLLVRNASSTTTAVGANIGIRWNEQAVIGDGLSLAYNIYSVVGANGAVNLTWALLGAQGGSTGIRLSFQQNPGLKLLTFQPKWGTIQPSAPSSPTVIDYTNDYVIPASMVDFCSYAHGVTNDPKVKVAIIGGANAPIGDPPGGASTGNPTWMRDHVTYPVNTFPLVEVPVTGPATYAARAKVWSANYKFWHDRLCNWFGNWLGKTCVAGTASTGKYSVAHTNGAHFFGMSFPANVKDASEIVLQYENGPGFEVTTASLSAAVTALGTTLPLTTMPTTAGWNKIADGYVAGTPATYSYAVLQVTSGTQVEDIFIVGRNGLNLVVAPTSIVDQDSQGHGKTGRGWHGSLQQPLPKNSTVKLYHISLSTDSTLYQGNPIGATSAPNTLAPFSYYKDFSLQFALQYGPDVTATNFKNNYRNNPGGIWDGISNSVQWRNMETSLGTYVFESNNSNVGDFLKSLATGPSVKKLVSYTRLRSGIYAPLFVLDAVDASVNPLDLTVHIDPNANGVPSSRMATPWSPYMLNRWRLLLQAFGNYIGSQTKSVQDTIYMLLIGGAGFYAEANLPDAVFTDSYVWGPANVAVVPFGSGTRSAGSHTYQVVAFSTAGDPGTTMETIAASENNADESVTLTLSGSQGAKVTWNTPLTDDGGSPTPSVAGYNVYLDGFFLATVGPGLNQYVDNGSATPTAQAIAASSLSSNFQLTHQWCEYATDTSNLTNFPALPDGTKGGAAGTWASFAYLVKSAWNQIGNWYSTYIPNNIMLGYDTDEPIQNKTNDIQNKPYIQVAIPIINDLFVTLGNRMTLGQNFLQKNTPIGTDVLPQNMTRMRVGYQLFGSMFGKYTTTDVANALFVARAHHAEYIEYLPADTAGAGLTAFQSLYAVSRNERITYYGVHVINAANTAQWDNLADYFPTDSCYRDAANGNRVRIEDGASNSYVEYNSSRAATARAYSRAWIESHLSMEKYTPSNFYALSNLGQFLDWTSGSSADLTGSLVSTPSSSYQGASEPDAFSPTCLIMDYLSMKSVDTGSVPTTKTGFGYTNYQYDIHSAGTPASPKTFSNLRGTEWNRLRTITTRGTAFTQVQNYNASGYVDEALISGTYYHEYIQGIEWLLTNLPTCLLFEGTLARSSDVLHLPLESAGSGYLTVPGFPGSSTSTGTFTMLEYLTGYVYNSSNTQSPDANMKVYNLASRVAAAPPTTGASLSLRWNEISHAGANLGVQWNDRVPVATTRQIIWNTPAVVGQGRAIQWNDLVTVGAQIGLQWQIAPGVGASIGLQWNDLAPIGANLGVQWNDNFAQGVTLQQIWGLRGAVGVSVQELWNNRFLVGSSTQYLWNNIAASGAFLAVRWGLIGTATRSIGVSYNTRSLVTDNLQLIFNATTAVGTATAFSWKFQKSVGANLGFVWNNFSNGVVGAQLSELWNLIAHVGNQASEVWNVRTTVGAAIGLQWNDRKIVGVPIGLQWKDTSVVGQQRQLVFNVRAVTSKTVALQWGLGGSIGAQISALWNLRAVAASTRSFLWSDRNLVATTRQVVWNDLLIAGQSRQVLWNDRVPAFKALGLAWNDNVKATRSISFVWSQNHLVHADKFSEWMMLSVFAKTLGLQWDEISPVSASIGLQWQMASTFAGVTLGLVWITRPYEILYGGPREMVGTDDWELRMIETSRTDLEQLRGVL